LSLPVNLPKRGLSKDEAAEYCGVSVNTLGRHGPVPTKIGDRTIYDRRVLDRWLDELAGFISGKSSEADLGADTPEEALLKAIHARQAALRRTSR
jgi:DNA-directed RNA polymerase specialized sigma24 family protein